MQAHIVQDFHPPGRSAGTTIYFNRLHRRGGPQHLRGRLLAPCRPGSTWRSSCCWVRGCVMPGPRRAARTGMGLSPGHRRVEAALVQKERIDRRGCGGPLARRRPRHRSCSVAPSAVVAWPPNAGEAAVHGGRTDVRALRGSPRRAGHGNLGDQRRMGEQLRALGTRCRGRRARVTRRRRCAHWPARSPRL